MEQITDDIYSFPILLPENPLKWLNCYVIKPRHGRCLLIDSGFRREECTASLLAGIAELGLEPGNTDVFFTHLHADHTGNGGLLQELGFTIYMSAVDDELRSVNPRRLLEPRMRQEGMSETVLQACLQANHAGRFAPEPFTAHRLKDGDILTYGSHRLECVLTPGHTPGHMCLLDRENSLMFLGDHVLFDITPNITCWVGFEDALGAYLASLAQLRSLDVKTALPAHRTVGKVTANERIDTLLAHHAARLQEAEDAVRANPGITAYDTAGKMTWKVRGGNGTWEDFPAAQRWFAVGETLSHMDRLVVLGRIRRTAEDGTVRYYPAE